MMQPKPMRDFDLEVFFSEWEFAPGHHMTASDVESLATSDLLAMATPEDRGAFDNLWLGYTTTWGAPALRDEIAGTYDTLTRDDILCLAGAGEGLYALAKAMLSPGDHVIVPTPNYQSAETVPLSVCEVTGVPLRRSAGQPARANQAAWYLDLEELKAAVRPDTRLISLNFPNNPTGMVMPRTDLEELVAFCRERGIHILVDEVYRGIELDADDRLPQIADIYEKGISLNVMSKAYGLPGLRVGWLASRDRDVLQQVERYKHFLSICNSGPSEVLTLIALKSRDRILARNRALVAQNLDLLERLFDDFPGLVEWDRPQGGCVAFPRFIGPGGGEAFCRALLEESSVLLLPSSIYKSDVGAVPPNHFRIGFGRDKAVKDGLVAMRAHFESHYPTFSR